MGEISTLKQRPDLYEQCLSLIEGSLGYEEKNSFSVDFAPLMDQSNHMNCFILIENEDKILAHVAAKETNLEVNGKEYPVTMLGGIAVDKNRRGEGHFEKLFQEVIAEKRSECAFLLLWSDLEILYKKYGFHLCGTQYEVSSKEDTRDFIETRYELLSEEEKEQIKKIYSESFSSIYLTPKRKDRDWKLIEKITSAHLYIKKENEKISDYFFMNKGQDLSGVIYEYGTRGQIELLLEDIRAYGKVWSGKSILPSEEVQFQFFLSPADKRIFSRFISSITEGKISVRDINTLKQEIFIDYNDETLALDIEDFLRGIFGPGTFEELNIRSVFFSGLDSI